RARRGADRRQLEPPGGAGLRRGVRGPEAVLAVPAGQAILPLDRASPEGHARIIAAIKGADVFVDNLRPGSAAKLGLGWEDLKAVNPRLVYCSISGFGRDVSRPAYDHVVQAASGMTLCSGAAEDPPSKIGFPLIDAGAGILAALAIVSALRERDRRGEGMLLDVSMASAALQLMYPLTCDALTNGTRPPRQGNQAFSGSPAADIFPTRDGGQIALGANTPAQFLRLLDVLQIAEIGQDPALFDPPLSKSSETAFLRTLDPKTVKVRLAAAVARFDADTLEAELTAARVPAAVVRALDEFARDAQAAGEIETTVLEDNGVRVVSPGLGFRVS
ncbi:MAG: CoA transferase, partial [Hyphomicrobiaceae bacterium]